jgi:ubiquinone/menaquinone biosynthesis C-methylase UbiE
MHQALGQALRPGGLETTRQGLEQAPLAISARILDAGCGLGATAAFLVEQGYRQVVALDRDSTLLRRAQAKILGTCLQGDITALPLATESVDAVFCECVLSLVSWPKQALAEIRRVLRPGGRLYYSDLYARATAAPAAAAPGSTCLAAPASRSTLRQRLDGGGWQILRETDQTELLRQTAARIIFEHGSLERFWQAVFGACRGTSCAAGIQALRPGYVSYIAVKTH